MRFFLATTLLVAVGVMYADANEDAQARKMSVMRILDAEPNEMIFCNSDADCSGPQAQNKTKCDMMIKLCKATDAPDFEMEYGSCQNSEQCRPKYRCKNNKCYFAGPKPCQSEADCLSGVEGLGFECKEFPKNAPGKRCWTKCMNDKDCFECQGDKCRIPVEAQQKIQCCAGVCQRKKACQAM